MSNSQDILKIAAALSLRGESTIRINAALQELTPSPLAEIIYDMLAESDALEHRDALEGMAQLNQGRLEDLDSAEFRSYIIRKLALSESILDACVRAVCTYSRVRHAALSGADNLLAAARSEQGRHGREVSAADVLRELRRRK